MTAPADSRFFHDLRAPLARARTYCKLISEIQPRSSESEELLQHLQKALEDLEILVRAAESAE